MDLSVSAIKDVEAVRAKMRNETKYDWSDVPSDVLFIATTHNKKVIGFCGTPRLCNSCWDTNYEYYYLNNQPFKGDWKDSLEERPYESE